MENELKHIQKENSIYIEVPLTINLAFNLHGILDTYVKEMIVLLRELEKNKFIIHVLSDLTKRQAEQELDNLGYISEIHYHYLFSIVDHIKLENKNTLQLKDNTWCKYKGYYCKIMHCKYLFDNSIKCKNYIPPIVNFEFINSGKDIQKICNLLY